MKSCRTMSWWMSERSGRLALLTSQMEDGGAQRAMLKLAGGLAERGYPVDLVLTQARGAFLAEVSPAVRVVDLGAPRVAASVPALCATCAMNVR